MDPSTEHNMRTFISTESGEFPTTTDGINVPLKTSSTCNFSIYDQRRYTLIFKELIKGEEEEFVSFSTLKEFMLRNQYEIENFEIIWNLCDHNRTGKLMKEQFSVFIWLMERGKGGIEVPVSSTDTDIEERFSETVSESRQDETLFENTLAENYNNEIFNLNDFKIEDNVDRSFIINTLSRIQVQTEEIQETLFEQEMRILREQERNNHCFLKLKDFRVQIFNLQTICTNGVREIRNLIFELADKKVAGNNNMTRIPETESHFPNTTSNHFDSLDDTLKNSKFNESLLCKSTNPFCGCSEHWSSYFGPHITPDDSSTPVLSSIFFKSIDAAGELEGTVEDCSEILDASQEGNILFSATTLGSPDRNVEEYDQLLADSSESSPEPLIEAKKN